MLLLHPDVGASIDEMDPQHRRSRCVRSHRTVVDGHLPRLAGLAKAKFRQQAVLRPANRVYVDQVGRHLAAVLAKAEQQGAALVRENKVALGLTAAQRAEEALLADGLDALDDAAQTQPARQIAASARSCVTPWVNFMSIFSASTGSCAR